MRTFFYFRGSVRNINLNHKRYRAFEMTISKTNLYIHYSAFNLFYKVLRIIVIKIFFELPLTNHV